MEKIANGELSTGKGNLEEGDIYYIKNEYLYYLDKDKNEILLTTLKGIGTLPVYLYWNCESSQDIVNLNLEETEARLIVRNYEDDNVTKQDMSYEISVMDSQNSPFEVIINNETLNNKERETDNVYQGVIHGDVKGQQELDVHIKIKEGYHVKSKEEVKLKVSIISPLQEEKELTIQVIQNNIIDSSGNNYHAKLMGGAEIVQDNEGKYAIQFDGIDDYVEIPTLSGNFNYSEGLTINAIVEYEAFNNNSIILMLGNGYDISSGDGYQSIILQAPGTSGKLASHVWTTARASIDHRTNQLSTETNKAVLQLNQKLLLNATITKKTVDTYFTGKISVNNTEVGVSNTTVSSVIFGIDEVDRTQNYLGKSSWPSDGYFKGKIYSIELLDADGKQVFCYDLNR